MNYTLGESLLDIIMTNIDQVVARPGGSMLNTAVSLARMSHNVTHITELGDNAVAIMITRFLKENGVDTSKIKTYPNTNTSVALAFLDAEKKPTYQFVHAYPITRKLNQPPDFSSSDLLLFGSIYSVSAAIRNEVLNHVLAIKKAGGVLMYDPNIRHQHHLNDADINHAVMENFKLAHIIKASDEDCANIFGYQKPEHYLDALTEVNPNALIFLTLGEKGAVCKLKEYILWMEAIETTIVSTIGAGDAFNAGIIAEINKQNITAKNYSRLSENHLTRLLKAGIQTASKVCASYDNYINRSGDE